MRLRFQLIFRKRNPDEIAKLKQYQLSMNPDVGELKEYKTAYEWYNYYAAEIKGRPEDFRRCW